MLTRHIDIQVFSGLPPYFNIPKDVCIFLSRVRGDLPARPIRNAFKDEYWELMNRCWEEPASRPSAKNVHDALASLSPLSLRLLAENSFAAAPFVIFPLIS